jgi:hypothetical protein
MGGRIKKGDESKYDIINTLLELLQMPQCTPTQQNNEKEEKNVFACS